MMLVVWQPGWDDNDTGDDNSALCPPNSAAKPTVSPANLRKDMQFYIDALRASSPFFCGRVCALKPMAASICSASGGRGRGAVRSPLSKSRGKRTYFFSPPSLFRPRLRLRNDVCRLGGFTVYETHCATEHCG